MNTHLQRIRQAILAEFGNSCERCLSEISTLHFWILDPPDDRPADDPAYAQIHYHPVLRCLEVENSRGHILLFAALDKCLMPRYLSNCEGVIFCPSRSVPTALWVELKMNMIMRVERRSGQLQTKTLGDRIQEAIDQMLESRQRTQSTVAVIGECKHRGYVGIPSYLEKYRRSSAHINGLLRKTQKEQNITVVIGSKLIIL